MRSRTGMCRLPYPSVTYSSPRKILNLKSISPYTLKSKFSKNPRVHKPSPSLPTRKITIKYLWYLKLKGCPMTPKSGRVCPRGFYLITFYTTYSTHIIPVVALHINKSCIFWHSLLEVCKKVYYIYFVRSRPWGFRVLPQAQNKAWGAFWATRLPRRAT